MQYTEHMDNESLLGIIRRACNYVDLRLMDHGFRVSRIVSRLLRTAGCVDKKALRDICILAVLHDIGAYKTEEISKLLHFDTANVKNHSIYGYLFTRYFSPLADYAPAILLHHSSWYALKDVTDVSSEIKDIAQLIYVADRIDIAIEVEHCSWKKIMEILEKESGTRFSPRIVALAAQNDFTKPAGDEEKNDYLQIISGLQLTQKEITEYLNMLIYAIDFRSRHTVTHTITTTSISRGLAMRMGLNQQETNQIICGALLHDLGKIGVPVEILEFPGKLSPQAMNIMRTHVDLTEKIFGGCIEKTIARISLRHHEKLNGSGYPRELSAPDLTVGERIVAIADIVSALAGTRSYKEAYSKDRILSIITQMRDDNLIDPDIVHTMIVFFDEIMEETRVYCQPVLDIYDQVQVEYDEISKQLTG